MSESTRNKAASKPNKPYEGVPSFLSSQRAMGEKDSRQTRVFRFVAQ